MVGGAGTAMGNHGQDHGSFFRETAWTKYVIRGIAIFRRCTTIYGLMRLDNLILGLVFVGPQQMRTFSTKVTHLYT
jgi:hypothetical protein